MLLAQACGSPQTPSRLDAHVSVEQADAAYRKIAAIDYLPFGYKLDGCFARALFMSMELAEDDIPSSAQFAKGVLMPTADITWVYHVAPMLIVGSDSEPTIIDPSLFSAPTKLRTWVEALNAFAPSQPAPELVAIPGSVYDTDGPPTATEEQVIHSFAELPRFKLSDISLACQAAHAYLVNENATNVTFKKEKLQTRANQLVRRLHELEKLDLGSFEAPPASVRCD